MRIGSLSLLILFAAAAGLTVEARAESVSSVTIYVWGPINNRVLRIAQFETEGDTGLIGEIRISDNCRSDRPDPEAAIVECQDAGRVELKETDDQRLTYEIDRRGDKGEIRFVMHDESIVVSSDFFEGERTIRFAPSGDSYSVFGAGSVSYRVHTGDSFLSVASSQRSTSFAYEEGERFVSVSTRTPTVEHNATVQTDGQGYYKIEMPPYGDPGEFSHRIEVWTDRPSRGTLWSAAINSYLLPAGTFDFIFPFFAPTPQEILEQAAATE